MSEEWCPNKVVVECWDSLAGIDIAKLHEWRLVLGLDDDGLAQIVFRNVLVFLVLLAVVVDENAAHPEV